MAMKKNKTTNITREMPVITLQEMTLFPGLSMQFDLEKKPSIRAVEAAMTSDQEVFLINRKNTEDTTPTLADLAAVGTVAYVEQVIKTGSGLMRIQVVGRRRGILKSLDTTSAVYLTGEVAEPAVKSKPAKDGASEESERRLLLEAYQKYCMEFGMVDPRVIAQIKKIRPVGEMADRIGANLPISEEEKLTLLEKTDPIERGMELIRMISTEIEIVRARKELSEEISNQIDKHQREYMLREQLSFIQNELDGADEEASETAQFAKAAEELQCSEEVRTKLKREIRHLEQNGFGNPESASLRSYIETLLELPWDKTTPDYEKKIDIKHAKEVLERDHYGLKDVKERVLEYLAVRTLTKRGDAPILCLVGPPGTGKTSIAKSIAEATKKPYVRICLGGVRDEAEIRGHRKTYVGAMPGRITEAVRQAKVKDPLMLLDEIDKMSQDYRGDTASAMLEVLDAEQNKNFRDHYLELPMDLSQVLFIATANDESTIPRPLLDRMEIIEIAGYTANEKFHIAREHLMKKVLDRNGISESRLIVSDGAIRRIIDCYCREAGVRQLERELDKLCRKAAVEILKQEAPKRGRRSAQETKKRNTAIRVSERNLEEFLGKIRFPKEELNRRDDIGIVRGLAWTSVGGDTLQIEVNIMPGKGELELTGQLGDVMKESAVAGLSYVRSISARYGIDADFFQKHDIHIHIPEGAVPKDGPSAGITMATAVLSAITKTKVRRDIAMTGEISLRGRVMPVGGLKEKILAAKNLGVKTVLVPFENRRDVEEIDREITDGVELVYVRQMDEVISRAFIEKKAR